MRLTIVLLALVAFISTTNKVLFVRAQEDDPDADPDAIDEDTTIAVISDEEVVEYEAYFDTRTRLFLS